MNTKTAEEILKENLKNIHFIQADETYALVLKSMEEYASPLKKTIQELEDVHVGDQHIIYDLKKRIERMC